MTRDPAGAGVAGRASRFTADMYRPPGETQAARNLRRLLAQVAPFSTPVLLEGEPGTPKEHAARYLHAMSGRRTAAFVALHCDGVPRDLLDSELFGLPGEAGGRFAAAAGGTLFIDDIDRLPLAVQARLVRALGGEGTASAPVRLVAGSTRPLAGAVRQGRFDATLQSRLAVYPVALPPLREQAADLSLFVAAAREHCRDAGLVPCEFSQGALRVLRFYPWPGNQGELAGLVEKLSLLFPGGAVDIAQLPAAITNAAPLRQSDRDAVAAERAAGDAPQDLPLPGDGVSLKDYLERVEIALIRRALHETGGVVAHAARRLGIRRTTLAEKKKRYDIS